MNSLLQLSNLAVTASDIFMKAQKDGGTFGWVLAIVSIAAMLVAWLATLGSIDDAVYGEGGWIDGKPHSKGGKWINAEGKEFMIKKKSAIDLEHKYPGLLDSLNKDGIHSVWNELNMGLNRDNIPIIIDSRGAEERLDELIKLNKEMPRDMGDEIWYYKNGTKYVIKKK